MKKYLFLLITLFTIQAFSQFSEGFENGLPADWSIINGSDANAWNVGTTVSGGAHTGTKVARLFYDPIIAHNDFLITKQFLVSTNVSNRLSFWYRHVENAYPETFNLMISTTGTAEANFINLVPNLIAADVAWQQYFFDLSSYVGLNVYIAFKSTTVNKYHLYIDDVVIDAVPSTIPSCVTGLTALPDVNCGNFKTPISWNFVANATGYRINVGTTAGGTDILNNVDVGNVNSYFVINQMANTAYYYKIIPYNLIGSAINCLEFNYETFFAPCYCIPNPAAVDPNGITNFTMGSINKSTNDVNRYDDFTSLSTNVAQGNSQAFSIKVDNNSNVYKMNIWIDWNNDFDFDDALETAFTGLSTNVAPNFVTGSITVPANAIVGQHRMRVGGQDVSITVASACYSGQLFACFEDYTLNVTQNLVNEQFTKSSFIINANEMKLGNLIIRSSLELNNSRISVYDLQGRLIDLKTTNLLASSNLVQIKPISTSGIYIVEIVSGDRKIAQKIAVQ